MTISLKVLCREIISDLQDGDYEVSAGLCAAEVLACCSGLPRERVENLMFMCNGKHIRPETVLTEGDRLLVLRPLHGG